MRWALCIVATLVGCAQVHPSPAKARWDSNLLRNGDAEEGIAPWDLSPHAWTRGLAPGLSTAPAPDDVTPLPPPKAKAGQALELNLPSEWNVVIISQEIRGASTSCRLEGFLRVSSDFEGSVQAVLAENAGLAIISFAKRAGYNNAPSVFIPFYRG